MTYKTFYDYTEVRVSELIITALQTALLNNELLLQHVLEPAFETAVYSQLNVSFTSPVAAETLTAVIPDLDRTDSMST